jgi:hypothetical protein
MADFSVELTMFLSSPARIPVANEISISRVKMRFIYCDLVSDLGVDAGDLEIT